MRHSGAIQAHEDVFLVRHAMITAVMMREKNDAGRGTRGVYPHESLCYIVCVIADGRALPKPGVEKVRNGLRGDFFGRLMEGSSLTPFVLSGLISVVHEVEGCVCGLESRCGVPGCAHLRGDRLSKDRGADRMRARAALRTSRSETR